MSIKLIWLLSLIALLADSKPARDRAQGLMAAMDGIPRARCDGATDDTEAIQAALNLAGAVRLPAGTCVVRPLFVRSDTAIDFAPRTTLRAKAGYRQAESIQEFPQNF